MGFHVIAIALGGLSCSLAYAMGSGRPGHGLIGYGINMYDPLCAKACRDGFSSAVLDCSEELDMERGNMMDMGAVMTSPECYATDDAFLQSLAYCMHQRCNATETWKLEQWWVMQVAGQGPDSQPVPQVSYQDTLAKVLPSSPQKTLEESTDPLREPMLVVEENWISARNGNGNFEAMEKIHSRYGLVVFLSGVVIPVGFSLLRFIPWPLSLVTTFNAWIVEPPAFGTRHKEPIFTVAHVPTRGQALFVAYLIALNIILSSVSMSSQQPNSWFSTTKAEIIDYVAARTGILSLANFALLFLYAGRNNFLIWITDWSHGTFLMLHRWVAWIATMQAVIHSILFLYLYGPIEGKHATESKLAYWIWGVIATLAMSILLPSSILPIRRKFYEMFLAWHVVLAILSVAGCYYHIIYRFQTQWGYDTWIYMAIAVWVFDRIVRVARLARNGVCAATVKIIDSDYMRVDVEGVTGNGHAYLYFPTLTWRFWENHPFSVMSAMRQPSSASVRLCGTTETPSNPSTPSSPEDSEKHIVRQTVQSPSSGNSDAETSQTSLDQAPKSGLTFLLRRHNGLTSRLSAWTQETLPVLVESSYAPHASIPSHAHLVAIVGGVGITSALPVLLSHSVHSRALTGVRSKLYWGVRTSTLVTELSPQLEAAQIEREVFVGERMNVKNVLKAELGSLRDMYAEKGKGKVVVFVCGPSGMADEARVAVSGFGRGQMKGRALQVEYVEEAYGW